MLRLDHLVILVNDLQAAAADYSTLGFRVIEGGRHADGLTENVLIGFEDGTYIELIAFVDAGDSRDNTWGWRQFASRGGGLIDYCMASANLDADIDRLRSAGLTVSAAVDGGRQRPDGVELRWRSARIWQSGRELPFLIQDVTPRDLRVAAGQARAQPNGVAGIRELAVAVADVERTAAVFATLLETDTPSARPDHKRDGLAATFDTEAARITLVESRMETGAVQLQIERVGVGPFEATLRSPSGRIALDERRLHGARLRVDAA